MTSCLAEYVWIDGYVPTANIRSKTKVLSRADAVGIGAEDLWGGEWSPETAPIWGFDGSSTQQAEGFQSDCVLRPVHVTMDPLRDGFEDILVLCEVDTVQADPHPSNTRASLVELTQNAKVQEEKPWFGFEQEYTLIKDSRPLGWPVTGFPDPQGRYYCGAGVDEVAGRSVVEEHLRTCMEAEISICGINAEVMLGQWEYQVGAGEALAIADGLILSRYLLYRIAEQHGVSATLHPKPVRGDWNGAGLHTNFSTVSMRDGAGIRAWGAITGAVDALSKRHKDHIEVYGAGNSERLTGLHETCPIGEFRSGVSDRGASVRIPWQVARDKHGYIEDRRPAANADPYQVAERLIRTVVLGE